MTDAQHRIQGRHKTKTPNGADDRLLDELRRQFDEFRRRRTQPTRIPDALRQAAIEALGRGTKPSALRRSCGVTAEQLDQWQQDQPKAAPAAGNASERPRAQCFSVGHATEASDSVAKTVATEPLELRVGAWMITIRPSQG